MGAYIPRVSEGDLPASPETIQRLRASEELYARAFMSNPVAMSVTDAATGRFTHINTAFSKLVGHNRTDIIGRTSQQMGFWPAREDRDRIGERIQQDDSLALVKGEIRIKGGASVRVLVSFRFLPLGPGPAILSVLVPLPEDE